MNRSTKRLLFNLTIALTAGISGLYLFHRVGGWTLVCAMLLVQFANNMGRKES